MIYMLNEMSEALKDISLNRTDASFNSEPAMRLISMLSDFKDYFDTNVRYISDENPSVSDLLMLFESTQLRKLYYLTSEEKTAATTKISELTAHLNLVHQFTLQKARQRSFIQ